MVEDYRCGTPLGEENRHLTSTCERRLSERSRFDMSPRRLRRRVYPDLNPGNEVD